MRIAALLSAFLTSASPLVAQQAHLVIVSGLSGEPRYADSFHEWASTLIEAAEDRWGVPASNVVYLAEKLDRDPDRISGRSTRENVERALHELAARAGPDDQVFIVLIGHGSAREGQSWINLPGPDMSGASFADLLELFPTQKICFVNAASASGGFIPALSGPNRTIVTATKTERERNETVFAAYFIEAYSGEGADTDKDERVSVLEAFDYAVREVARSYEADGRLLTEHALLDDNGDGAGSSQPGSHGPDGKLARSQFLAGGAAALGASELPSDPRLATLYRERLELEQQVAALRDRKDRLAPEEYERELERLLVDLALKNREIRELEGKEK